MSLWWYVLIAVVSTGAVWGLWRLIEPPWSRSGRVPRQAGTGRAGSPRHSGGGA